MAPAGGATRAGVGSGAAIDVTSCSIAEVADAASASASCTTTSFTAASDTAIDRSAGLHTTTAAGEIRVPPRWPRSSNRVTRIVNRRVARLTPGASDQLGAGETLASVVRQRA